jgi:hypothetical protein
MLDSVRREANLSFAREIDDDEGSAAMLARSTSRYLLPLSCVLRFYHIAFDKTRDKRGRPAAVWFTSSIHLLPTQSSPSAFHHSASFPLLVPPSFLCLSTHPSHNTFTHPFLLHLLSTSDSLSVCAALRCRSNPRADRRAESSRQVGHVYE